MMRRAINLDKDNSSRRQPSTQSQPSRSTSEVSTWGVKGTRELGSYGGISGVADAQIDLGNIAAQKASITVNPVAQSAQVEIELGIKKGLEVSGSIEATRTPTGIEISNVSFGVNALGFGVNAEGKGNESSKLGIQVFGAKVEIASDKEGRTSVRIGFELPGIEAGITLQPDGKKKESEVSKPVEFPGAPPEINKSVSSLPPINFANNCLVWEYSIVTIFGYMTANGEFFAELNVTERPEPPDRFKIRVQNGGALYYPPYTLCSNPRGACDISDPYVDFIGIYSGHATYSPNGRGAYFFTNAHNKRYAKSRLTGKWHMISEEYREIRSNCPKPQIVTPTNLPNLPQQYKPMNCCDKIEEIYKYLGIAKLKKHKMKIAKAFLAPGGKGTEDCEDYYQITQALFRMLANGLIINPKSKPLGSEWQSTNATAWASSMYEMMAEAMSDGNSSQRFEIAAMMQLVQIMSAIAENTRKVEFVADGLGFEPDLIKEDLPVCFTIYEKHKGFGKFDPKKINTSNIKTDEEVEAVLGKMLNPSKVPIVKWQLKSDETTIKEGLNG
ncbi:hypothetical protein [Chroococcidiopsis sp.]|uniref:hypothetical protein n=1 Tax=Chroococcidiopsis sp. TaxID=3088168 RepID=UPI003F40040E